jgi:membrane protein
MSALAVVGKTFSRWNDHEGQRLGAALAFYALLSAAPLVVLALLIASTFLGQDKAERRMVDYATQTMGSSGASIVNTILSHARQPHRTDLAALTAIFALLFGASGAFLELRDDLNKMWDAQPPRGGILGILAQRIFSFVLVLAAGAILLISMLATAAVSVIARFFANLVPVPPWLLETANIIVSFLLLTGIFLLIFRFVPDLALPWRLLLPGAGVSALLLVCGKAILGLYLTKAGVGSAYGAAGSIVAVAFFVYYAAQIFLFGAEFTYIWARRKMGPGTKPWLVPET